MSNILVNTIKDTGNNTLLSSDGSGSVTLGSGFPTNTPSFFAYKSSNQSISEASWVKATFDIEDFDTDSAFASSRFTVPSDKAGKYYFQSSIRGAADGGTMEYIIIRFYKNGSGLYTPNQLQTASNQLGNSHIFAGVVLDLSVGDYVETYVQIGGNNPNIGGGATTAASFFGGYKLIGA